MFLALIQKQMKILLRSRSELLMLFVMPIILITILSFALGSLMEGNSEMTKVELAIVLHDNEEEQLNEFRKVASETFPINDEMEKQMKQMLPISMLLEQLTKSEEMKEFIHVTELKPNEFENARKSEEFSAIIEVPEHFTVNFLTSIFMEGDQPAFNVYVNESEPITSTVVKNILDFYQQQYTFFTALAKNGFLSDEMTVPTPEIKSEIQTVDTETKINSSIYYTFSMSVMFILFIAGTIAGQSFLEKNMHIFDRILLARIHPLTYLASMIVSTVVIAFIQVAILFAFAYFAFGISLNQWGLTILLTLLLAIVVGGITALLSSINYRSNSANASNIFSNALVSILALLGGSFFNISGLSPVLGKIGMWTPNGAALDGYLKLAQNGSLSDIQHNLMNLAVMAIVLIVCAVLLFPKRGGIA
ncbi:ABC transporter permease [Lysinibacillus antri]|uniref:ABC transporter permease n=1 Tax=Lysinibacillus antri TaxID=2498145 RepID=A0A432LGA9_9BACI|nr:ABC transporter permease [Lysinibacillus antri]RUL56985.1 ABC transporter permease [Lysinibacillus antri]